MKSYRHHICTRPLMTWASDAPQYHTQCIMKHIRLHGYCWMHQGRQQHPKKKRLFHVLCCLHLSILPRINNNPSFNLSWIFEQLSNAISNRAGITVGILSIGKQEIHFIAIINHISFQKNKNWAKLLCS